MKSILLSLLLSGLAAFSSTAGEANQLDAAEKAEGWKLLFNGRDLEGWRTFGKQQPPGAGWTVSDGVLKKLPKVRGGDIITTGQFDDFELSWEWRIAPGANNGVKYLVTEARTSAPGHEYQMIDDAHYPGGKLGVKQLTASFYDVLPPVPGTQPKPAGEWNTSLLRVHGNLVEHWLNGTKALAYELGSAVVKEGIAKSKFRDKPGFGDKIRGHILLTDHGDECWFRNIKIRELKPAGN